MDGCKDDLDRQARYVLQKNVYIIIKKVWILIFHLLWQSWDKIGYGGQRKRLHAVAKSFILEHTVRWGGRTTLECKIPNLGWKPYQKGKILCFLFPGVLQHNRLQRSGTCSRIWHLAKYKKNPFLDANTINILMVIIFLQEGGGVLAKISKFFKCIERGLENKGDRNFLYS